MCAVRPLIKEPTEPRERVLPTDAAHVIAGRRWEVSGCRNNSGSRIPPSQAQSSTRRGFNRSDSDTLPCRKPRLTRKQKCFKRLPHRSTCCEFKSYIGQHFDPQIVDLSVSVLCFRFIYICKAPATQDLYSKCVSCLFQKKKKIFIKGINSSFHDRALQTCKLRGGRQMKKKDIQPK